MLSNTSMVNITKLKYWYIFIVCENKPVWLNYKKERFLCIMWRHKTSKFFALWRSATWRFEIWNETLAVLAICFPIRSLWNRILPDNWNYTKMLSQAFFSMATYLLTSCELFWISTRCYWFRWIADYLNIDSRGMPDISSSSPTRQNQHPCWLLTIERLKYTTPRTWWYDQNGGVGTENIDYLSNSSAQINILKTHQCNRKYLHNELIRQGCTNCGLECYFMRSYRCILK